MKEFSDSHRAPGGSGAPITDRFSATTHLCAGLSGSILSPAPQLTSLAHRGACWRAAPGQAGVPAPVERWRTQRIESGPLSTDHPKGARTKTRTERVVDLLEPDVLAAVNDYVCNERPRETGSMYLFLGVVMVHAEESR